MESLKTEGKPHRQQPSDPEYSATDEKEKKWRKKPFQSLAFKPKTVRLEWRKAKGKELGEKFAGRTS